MAVPTVRFIINAKGQPRVFLSAIETGTGKLRLIIRNGINRGDETSAESQIVQHRCSVHDSDRSPNYTTFHYCTIYQDGQRFDAHQLSDAIKKKNGFALLYIVAATNLAVPFYALADTSKSEIVDIGEYDPEFFHFCYAVAVGPPDLTFATFPAEPLNIYQHHFRRYSLGLMWSFALLKSAPISSMATVFTHPPESAKDAETEAKFREAMTGRTATDCMLIFLENRKKLMEEQIRKISAWASLDDYAQQQIRTFMTHMRTGTTNTSEYKTVAEERGIRLLQLDASLGRLNMGTSDSTSST